MGCLGIGPGLTIGASSYGMKIVDCNTNNLNQGAP